MPPPLHAIFLAICLVVAPGSSHAQTPLPPLQDRVGAMGVSPARAPLTGAVVTQIVAFCTENMQTIDHDTQDKVLRAEWDADAQTRATAFVSDFETFCRDHRDQLDALTIYYTQHQRRAHVTLAQIQAVLDTLRTHAPRLAPHRVWDAYARLDAVPDN
eukprot:gene63166-86401_t